MFIEIIQLTLFLISDENDLLYIHTSTVYIYNEFWVRNNASTFYHNDPILNYSYWLKNIANFKKVHKVFTQLDFYCIYISIGISFIMKYINYVLYFKIQSGQ